MKKISLLISLCACINVFAQGPNITSWLQNTTGITGRHYVNGNSTPIVDATLANVQTVQYSNDWVYVSATGIPAYITGPFLDNNPSIATNQNSIFKIPRIPTPNTGTLTPTALGYIGVFINGVALFDFRDGYSYKSSTGQNSGGPMGGPGDGVWNRDAIVAERAGFDCAKGHPAMGNYHHHQNPSAFNLDLVVLSNVCNLYLADGLYVINPDQHSPLLGFAYDGYPIYGAYSYRNADGTGGITRMKSSYSLRNITVRTHYADGSDVTDGPAVSSTFPLGMYREDYQYNATSAATPDYLDEHNGRFCVTPEYPGGTYAYFTTVDANYNSTYPYVVGPTFYGVRNVTRVTSITETTTTYTQLGVDDFSLNNMIFKVYPNPTSDLLAIQSSDMITENYKVDLIDETGRIVKSTQFLQGSTMCYFETGQFESGIYVLKISSGNKQKSFKVLISK